MDHFHWFALRSFPFVGNVTFCRLLRHFGSPEKAVSAAGERWSVVKGVTQQAVQAARLHDWREAAEREAAAVRKGSARIVDFLSEEYPKILLEIPDFPPFLYVRGKLDPTAAAVAVVGSRRASSSGLQVAERLSREMAERGLTVVSGMARGVDTAAHRGAIKGGGRTVAILGCGIDVIYPPENRPLFEKTAETGAVASEFPMGTLPLAENFPRRNRIISGMSRGVLVVEAAENSGSLITAEYALEQGRDVFAVPGNIAYPGSRGTNRLIKQGARLVETVEDIISELPGARMHAAGAPSAPSFSLSPEEAEIYALVAAGPLHIDDIIVKCELTVGEVSAILLRLELKGAVNQLPGKHFSVA